MKRALIIPECQQIDQADNCSERIDLQESKTAAYFVWVVCVWFPRPSFSRHLWHDDDDDGVAECIFCGFFSGESPGISESKNAKGGAGMEVFAAQKL
jgi:hypothetical protein